MLSPFYILALAAAAAAAVAAWMIVRARQPLKLPALNVLKPFAPKSPQDLMAQEHGWAAAAMNALRYLSARREWRYSVPWILLLGPAAAGKTSIAASVKSGARQTKLLREKLLEIRGTDWRFFNEGVVIDPSGEFASADPSSDAGKRWQAILEQLDSHRPERPLDGLVLVVSASTLLQGTPEARRGTADLCFRQLWELQKRFDFAFPVFIVIAQCDVIEGFSAFWKSQPDARRDEIFGWSSRYLLTEGGAGEWSDAAFASMESDLRALQVRAAADAREIDDADRFFLFPQRFRELRAPLQTFLETVFEASAYHANFYFMGVYFTGSIEAAGDVLDKPRSDVNFVDDLFAKKVFAETHLARPTRTGIWSRNRLIRRIQIAGLAVTASLFVALAVSGVYIRGQVNALTAQMDSLNKKRDELDQFQGCISRAAVYPLLSQIARVDVTARYVLIPAAYYDRRGIYASAQQIAEKAFRQIVFESIDCQLHARGESIAAWSGGAGALAPGTNAGSAQLIAQLTQSLTDHVKQVGDYETNLALFNEVKRPIAEDGVYPAERKFSELAQYVYEQPLPDDLHNDRGGYRLAIMRATYNGPSPRPADWYPRVSREIRARTTELAKRMIDEAGSGAKLLAEIDRSDEAAPVYPMKGEDILLKVRRFDLWADWTRSDWLNATQDSNPCKRIAEQLRGPLQDLKSARYGRLDASLEVFARNGCYDRVAQRLRQMRFDPYGQVFQAGAKGLEFSPAVEAEVKGLGALSGLGFMQGTVAEPFTCREAADAWQAQSLAQAMRFAREYEAFERAYASQAGADAAALPAGYPLYDRIARGYLNHVLDGIMTEAQVSAAKGSIARSGLGLASTPDEMLAQQSADFARVLDSLVQVLRMYEQLEFNDSRSKIVQCARKFSTSALQRIDALANASRLYEPSAGPAAGGAANQPFFALGNDAVIKDYLAQQLQRVSVLAGYAAPFVAFLRNTDAVSESSLGNVQRTPYWDNTITELSRYAQSGEPNGQVAYLQNLFAKQLPVLTSENCAKTLADYRAAAQGRREGNDLFSLRRGAIEKQVVMTCTNRSQSDAYAKYRDVAMRFNRELAGRYPFAGANAPDVSLAVVKSFFDDYRNQRDALRAAVGALGGDRWKPVQEFVARLEAAADFFASSLNAGDVSQPLHLDITFRALPARSPGSDQVIDWRLAIGEDAARYPNGKTDLDWPYGQPVQLDLAWARESIFRPVGDAAQPDYQASGVTATFVATGPWALLRMIDAHRPRSAPATDPLDPASALLEFVVPVANGATASAPPKISNTRMYLKLRLSGQDAKTHARNPVAPPAALPRSAPTFW